MSGKKTKHTTVQSAGAASCLSYCGIGGRSETLASWEMLTRYAGLRFSGHRRWRHSAQHQFLFRTSIPCNHRAACGSGPCRRLYVGRSLQKKVFDKRGAHLPSRMWPQDFSFLIDSTQEGVAYCCVLCAVHTEASPWINRPETTGYGNSATFGTYPCFSLLRVQSFLLKGHHNGQRTGEG